MATILANRDTSGHSFSKDPTLNAAGIVYTAFITCYTAFIIYSMYMLWLLRHNPAIRIRGFGVTIAAIIGLHIYLAALFIVYPLNSYYKCGTEFWYMSIIFPLGIAIFQAANIKLMAVSSQQRKLTDITCVWAEKKEPFTWSLKSFRCKFGQYDYVKKTYVTIGMGILLQLIVTIVLYFGSRRFNPESGFFGEHVDPTMCRSGPEWIPSVIWQFTWSWFFGPYVLYQTRHIQDTHNWALQTRLAVLACMPGTPMWLGFLYAGGEKLAVFNSWWPPAMWFAPGLITMQLSSIIIPLHEIWRKREPMRPASRHSSFSVGSSRGNSSAGQKMSSSTTSWKSFEFQLKHNIHTLFLFAATKDFSGENIIFLREVRDFKRKWSRRLTCPPTGGLMITLAEQRDMFEDAARIYFELICPETSRCVINLEYRISNSLKEIFKDVTYDPPADSVRRKTVGTSIELGKPSRRDIAPWDSPDMAPVSTHGSEAPLIDLDESARKPSEASDMSLSFPEAAALQPLHSLTNYDFDGINPINPSVSCPGQPLLQPDRAMTVNRGRIISRNLPEQDTQPSGVPATFNLRVFDSAESSIKYLVYTNTWKSYTNSMDRSRLNSLEMTPNRQYPTPSSIEPVSLPTAPRLDTAASRTDKKEAQITTIELYRPNLEMRDTDAEDLFEGMHDGVLENEGSGSPVPLHQADARCACCRKKAERARNSRTVVKQMWS